MAYAEQGAVVVESKNNKVVYKHKCEVCGEVEFGTKSHTLASGTLTSGFSCRCGNNQKVRISA